MAHIFVTVSQDLTTVEVSHVITEVAAAIHNPAISVNADLTTGENDVKSIVLEEVNRDFRVRGDRSLQGGVSVHVSCDQIITGH